MSGNGKDAATATCIGHAIVRRNPWRFQSADAHTRIFFDLPEGDITDLPLFFPENAALAGSPPNALDIIIPGRNQDRAVRANLLAIESHGDLFSAIFFLPSTATLSVVGEKKQQDIQHRVSNCLAVIRSIFRRTAQASQDMDTLVSHFLGRLDAVSRIQSNILLYDAYGVTLDELFLDEFMAYATRTGERLSISGPTVRLQTRAAETLSLAIHELATNSVKFGALGSDDGHIDVQWASKKAADGGPILSLQWIESGVPDVDPEPSYRGFGADMIENSMAFELGAETRVDFGSDGLRLRIDIPVTRSLLHEPIGPQGGEIAASL
ncbi:MAG: sensor histidine kinase [Sphingobium sp.]